MTVQALDFFCHHAWTKLSTIKFIEVNGTALLHKKLPTAPTMQGNQIFGCIMPHQEAHATKNTSHGPLGCNAGMLVVSFVLI